MAKNFLVDIDLNQNEIQNGVIQNLASNPSNPIPGQVYFNTTTNRFRVYTGTEWDEMGTGGGTVTSVGAQNATDGGLTISGSPVTESGTITIGHTNVLSSNQTTSAIYPITWDKNGHITSNGTAFNPSTKQDVIDDLDDIRSGAKAGATAVQPDALDDYAPLDSAALTGTPTAPTAAAGTSTTQIATTAFVQGAIDSLPEPMVFKGTLGTGGTISELPAASADNVGFTYKVITDGTYAGQSAKIGDTFISTGTAWELIPSGDEPSGTVTNIATGDGLTGGPITTTGTISLATSGVTAGTYQGLTVDTYGRITSAQDMEYSTMKKVTESFVGDGVSTIAEVTHNLGTKDVIVQVLMGAHYEEVLVDVERTTVNKIKVSFAKAPEVGSQFRIIIIG